MNKKVKILLIILLTISVVGLLLFFLFKKQSVLDIINKTEYRGSKTPNDYKNIPPEGRPFNQNELDLINDPKYQRVKDKAVKMGYRFTYEVPNANMEYVDGKMLTKKTKDSFNEMKRDLEIETGKEIYIGSGYRSVNRQYSIMQSNLPSNFNDGDIVDYLDGKSYPGTSTHHTGRAIDICVNNDSFGGCLNKSYWTNGNGKKAYTWLKENAKNYGFKLTYPENAIDLKIGAEFEPWHWEYIGN